MAIHTLDDMESAALYVPALENHGIDSLFDATCSTDEVSHGKTRPDIYCLAAKKLGVLPSKCIVFEDILEAIRSAKAAGMYAIGVYDPAAKDQWPDIRKEADAILLDWRDAGKLIPAPHSPET